LTNLKLSRGNPFPSVNVNSRVDDRLLDSPGGLFMSQTADEKLTAYIEATLGTKYTYHAGAFTAHGVPRLIPDYAFDKLENTLSGFLQSLVEECRKEGRAEEIEESKKGPNAAIWNDFGEAE
jgi:hypothetical protein